jgi:hypothetical protein
VTVPDGSIPPDVIGAIRLVLASLDRDGDAADRIFAVADARELVGGLVLLAGQLAREVCGERARELLLRLLFDEDTDRAGTGDRYWAAELDWARQTTRPAAPR